MVSPFRGSGPFRGRGPFLGRGPWAGKAPWGFNLGGVAWSPATLFAAGEQGAWYDPSDLSTLFQDSAGTTPVTAVEQPVGLMLDKSKGLVLGSELTTNGEFETDTGWTKGAGVTISGGKANFVAASGYVLYRATNAGVAPGGLYEVTFTVSNYVSGSIRVYLGSTPTFGATVSTNGTYTARFGPVAGAEIGFNSAAAFTGSIDVVSVKAVTGNHAFNTNATTVRPVLKQENGLYYLEFGGVDDWLQTASIDFSGTDKMSVFAGVRKLSDAAIGIAAELSAAFASNNGSWVLAAPGSTANAYSAGLRGNSSTSALYAAKAAPSSDVLSVAFDISGATVTDEVNLRDNGVVSALVEAAGPAGTGNFGNYPLYIGRRGGTTFPFNGRLYSLLVLGRTATADEIASAETWVNGKTGAY